MEYRITKKIDGVEKKEPPRAFLYFECYVKLGTKRSIRKVSQIYDKGEAQLKKLSMCWDWVERANEYNKYIIKKVFDEVEAKHVEIFKSCALIVHDLFEDILANVDEAETVKEKADLSKALKPYYPVDLLNDVFEEKKNKQEEYKFLFLCEALYKNKPNPKEEDCDLSSNFLAI